MHDTDTDTTMDTPAPPGVDVDALAARMTDFEAAAAPPPDETGPALDVVRRAISTERKARTVGTLRRMGLDSAITDAQALEVAPDVDPDDLGGVAALEVFRRANLRLFRSPVDLYTPESTVAAVATDVSGYRARLGGMFNADKFIAAMWRR